MILAKDRLILALDVPNFSAAKQVVEELSDEINFYKIGLELMASGSYFELVEFLKLHNKKVFADLKLYDIPATVGRAVRNLASHQIDLLTIHTANKEIMAAAVENKGAMKVVGVTVLTSLEQADLLEMGFDAKFSLEELVVKKAGAALAAGLDGVVASPLEAKILREKFGSDFLIVTPGIRNSASNDDQKRTADVKTALNNGASHLVVGRPIMQAKNMRQEAAIFNKLVAEVLS